MAEPPPGYYPSLLRVSTNGIPILDQHNWDEWSSVLLDVLAPYEGVVEYLMGGRRRQGDCAQLEAELLSLIHRTVSSNLRILVRITTDRYGRRGSQVFQALQRRHDTCAIPFQRETVKAELNSLQLHKGEILAEYIYRTEALFYRGKKVQYSLTPSREVSIFIKGLDYKFLLHQRAIKVRNQNPDWTWDKLALHLKSFD